MQVFKQTSDDWYPSYKLEDQQLVKVRLLELKNGLWRVCVWGNDDFGLERDYCQYEDAHEMFQIIIKQPQVSQKFLRVCGFVHV